QSRQYSCSHPQFGPPPASWQTTYVLTLSGSARPTHLVVRYGDCSRSLFLVLLRQLHRPELEGQLVDLAVERERHLVVLVVHTRSGIDPNIEGLVSHLEESDGVCLLLRVDDLAVHLQHTGAALGDARAVIGVVEHDRVFARGQWLLAFPAILSEDEHVVVEYRMTFEDVQPIAAPAPAHGDEHPVAAALWDLDVSGNRVRPAEDIGCFTGIDAGVHARVGEFRNAGGRTRPRRECPRKRIVV